MQTNIFGRAIIHFFAHFAQRNGRKQSRPLPSTSSSRPHQPLTLSSPRQSVPSACNTHKSTPITLPRIVPRHSRRTTPSCVTCHPKERDIANKEPVSFKLHYPHTIHVATFGSALAGRVRASGAA